ncbi:hypothetical protein OROGR_021625 [Orobanche gracilis]
MREHTKLNIDGSFTSVNGNKMDFGGVMRNDKGPWLFGLVGHSRGGTPFVAESLALLHGLKIAWSKGYRSIICETDCAELVKAVTETDLLEQLEKSNSCSGGVGKPPLIGFPVKAIVQRIGLLQRGFKC